MHGYDFGMEFQIMIEIFEKNGSVIERNIPSWNIYWKFTYTLKLFNFRFQIGWKKSQNLGSIFQMPWWPNTGAHEDDVTAQ